VDLIHTGASGDGFEERIWRFGFHKISGIRWPT